MPFTLACVQFAPQKAEVEQNLNRIAEVASQASSEGADLVVFPETATSGYFLEGGVLESSQTSEDLVLGLQNRINVSRPLDIALGFYEKTENDLFNSVAYIEFNGGRATLKHVYRKFFLPTYGVFDEERFVSRGRELGVFATRFGKVAILICEDIWHSILPTMCALKGASIMLVPSASPARGFQNEKPENLLRYERLLRGVSEEHAVFCANAMLTGFEGGKGFVGGSSIVDPFGNTIASSPIQEEHILTAEIDLDLVQIARAQSPLLSDLKDCWPEVVRLANTV